MFSVQINDNKYVVESIDELGRHLKDKKSSQYREIWIEYGASRMCALVTKKTGWLMFLRFEGDTGFSSRNPNYEGPENEMLKVKLANGQLDEYPLSWAYPENIWTKALLHFAKTGDPIDSVEWHDDN